MVGSVRKTASSLSTVSIVFGVKWFIDGLKFGLCDKPNTRCPLFTSPAKPACSCKTKSAPE